MTRQFDDLAARRTGAGWQLAAVPEGGGYRIHLLGDGEERLLSIDLASALPGFSRFARWTTAGMWWHEKCFAYFTTGQRHFVVRAWWGGRVVAALDHLRQVDPSGLIDELRQTERQIVMMGLRHLVARIEAGETPEYHDPSTDVINCSIDTLVYLTGILGLSEAVPLLRAVEEWGGAPGWCSNSFHFRSHAMRRLAQVSLRQLGERPIGYPVLTFTDEEKRLPLRQPQSGPVDGPTRHTLLARIKQGTPLAEVYRLLGGPDDLEDHYGRFWRYDVDADPPYSLLVWLAEEESVERIVRYYPPFWTGPDVFPFHERSAIDSDGRVVAPIVDDAFVGTVVELDLLHAFKDSGRYPLAPLARAILAGELDAIHPLIDALEEAGDPLAARVWRWRKW